MYVLPITGIIGESDEVGQPSFRYTDLLMHLNAAKEERDILLIINSIGGDVDEGQKMRDALLKSGKTFYSINSGDVASMAVSLFLVAPRQNRKFNPDKGVFLIHNPWTEVQGDSQFLNEVSKELKSIENTLSKQYAEATGTSTEILNEFMKEDKPLTAEQIESLGFATIAKPEFKAVAKININKHLEKMSKENEALNESIGKLDGFLAKLKTLISGGAKALMLQDSAGKELNFADLADDAVPAIGDKATVDGAPAEGSFVMPAGETLVFVAGELTEIIPAEDDEAAQLKQKIAELEAQLASSNAKITEAEAAKEALANEFGTQAKALEKELITIKASIKNLDFTPKKDVKKDAKKGDEPTIRMGYKRKEV